jgi:hypothetical protein
VSQHFLHSQKEVYPPPSLPFGAELTAAGTVADSSRHSLLIQGYVLAIAALSEPVCTGQKYKKNYEL